MAHLSAPSCSDAAAAQRRLVEALRDPACYPHPVAAVTLMETHISLVLLTGGYAYKIKKPLSLGFLDFTSLDARRRFCEEEVRLNARLAPGLYLDVVPIVGAPHAPRMGGEGTALEYAVRMIEFPQSALVDGLLDRGELAPAQVDAIAALIASFHGRAARSTPSQSYGSPQVIRDPCLQNFAQLRPLLDSPQGHEQLDAIERWTHAQLERLNAVFESRRRGGFVRECHGDLHLANLVWLDPEAGEGAAQAFDCIEFNDQLRWIDVMSEVAFLVMDLAQRGRHDYAHRLLDGYLQIAGDHAGLRVLPFYLVYRALVRAKVAALRIAQPGMGEAEQQAARCSRDAHLAYAGRVTRGHAPVLLITHGWSGSGKTTLSQKVLEATSAVRLRSDVERKRLHGMAALERRDSALGAGLYAAAANEATYAELERLADLLLDAGFPVIVDAAFLHRDQRRRFRALARRRQAAFLILDCRAPAEVLHARIGARTGDASDATAAVLEYQRATGDPLDADELTETLAVDTGADLQPAVDALLRRLPALAERQTP